MDGAIAQAKFEGTLSKERVSQLRDLLRVVVLVEPGERVEAFHFAGKARGVARGVEQRDRRNPRSSGENRLPRGFGPHPERRYQSDAGDDHSTTTASRSF